MDHIVEELISSPQELKVCRACLATDVKMYNLRESCLDRDFYDITGLQLSVKEGLPYHICYICCAMLKKAMKFRTNCYLSCNLLSNQVITPDFIKHTNQLHGKPLLMRTKIQIITSIDKDYTEKSPYTEIIKEESFLEMENDTNNIDQNDAQSVTDENLINEYLNYASEKEDGETKLYIINTKQKSSFEKLKKSLNRHTGDKYIDDTKHEEEEKDSETDSDNDFEPLSSYAIVNTNDDALIITKNNSSEHINEHSSKNKRSHYLVKGENASKGKKDKDSLKRKRTKTNKREMRTREAIEKFDKAHNCEVVELSIEEQIEVVKARAENKKYKCSKYKCEDCCTGFVVESKFISHRKTHDPAISGNIECAVCHARFKSRLQHMKHALRHKYKYICRECDAIFYCRSFAKNHFDCHNGIKYECQYCKQVFSKYGSRVNHIRIKHGSVECGICHELFGPAGLALHVSLAHKQTYKCSCCDRVFNDPDALNRHMRSPYKDICDPNLRPCTRCGECFQMGDEDLYNKHIEIHREMKKKKTSLTETGRNRTSKQYGFASNEEDEINCSNSSVDSKRDARSRLGTRSGRRGARTEKTKLMCEICALDNFQSITSLRYHQRIHTGEKPHACPACPKRFRLTHTLQWHIRTHTGDRPYACAECPKAFKTNTALCRHRLVHTNERRHVCDLCGKAFQTSTNVKLHVRSVHMRVPQPPRVRTRRKRGEQSAGAC